jgi:hypothetical protein
MLKKISLILIICLSLGYAKTDFELAGEVMMKATEEKAKYEALNSVIQEKDDRIATQALEIFIDKVLIVILACVKITL